MPRKRFFSTRDLFRIFILVAALACVIYLQKNINSFAEGMVDVFMTPQPRVTPNGAGEGSRDKVGVQFIFSTVDGGTREKN